MNKLSVIKMHMLRWICGKTLKDSISNKHIRELVGAAPIEDKMRENWLRWFRHIQQRSLEVQVRKCNLLIVHGNDKGRDRSKIIWIEIIEKDIIICNLSINFALNRAEWRKQIHVVNPT